MLGQELARLAAIGNRQLIVSTHSRDMLLGLLDGDQPAVVIRLQRDGDINQVSRLTRKQVEELWSDPLLRQSNIFDGLFSQDVVLCEGNTDCAYYAEVLNSGRSTTGIRGLPTSAPAFRHTNGKDKIAVAAEALRAAGVPLSTIVDIDVFSDNRSFARLVSSMGGVPEEFTDDLVVLREALAGTAPTIKVDEAREILLPLLARAGSGPITDDDRERVRSAFKNVSAWRAFGKIGISYFDDEDKHPGVRSSCQALIDRCRKIGIHVVPNGALESWAPELTSTKGRWLLETLDLGVEESSRFPEALAFVRLATERHAPNLG